MWCSREITTGSPHRLNVVAASHQFLAVSSGVGRTIDVSVQNQEEKISFSLEGHSAQVEILHALGWQLLSVASDYAILWNIQQCSAQVREGRMPSGTIIKQLPKATTAVCISEAQGKIALIGSYGISVYRAKPGMRQAETLCEDLALPADFITKFACLREDGDCILCVSNELALVVSLNQSLNQAGGILMQHVLVQSRQPIITACLADNQSELWFLTADDVLYLWRLPKIVRLRAKDGEAAQMEVRDVRNPRRCAEFSESLGSSSSDGGKPTPLGIHTRVLGVRARPESSQLAHNSNRSLLSNTELLLLAFDCALVLFDSRKMATISVSFFSDSLRKDELILDVALCSDAKLDLQPSPARNSNLHCFAISRSARAGYQLTCNLNDSAYLLQDPADENAHEQQIVLSAIADRSVRLPSSNATPQAASAGSAQRAKQTGDKPLTFHAKVKSSGYGQSAPSQMFKPRTNFGAPSSSAASRSSNKNSSTLLNTKYPLECPHASRCVSSVEICDKNAATPINVVRCSTHGKHLAAALANRTIQVWRFKKPAETGSASLLSNAVLHTVLLGHDAAPTDVNFSNNSELLVSCASDKTMRVWLVERNEQAGNTGVKNGSKASSASASASASAGHFSAGECVLQVDGTAMNGKKFDKEVKLAQFYYLDGFLLSAVGDRFCLFEYKIDFRKPDVQRYLTSTHFKLWKSFAFPTECNQITALSAINGFYSNLVLTASSNRGVAVFDLYHDGCVWQVADAHSRTCHQVVQCYGSPFATLSSDTYNLFATVAHQDCTKIWDLRSRSAVQSFDDYSSQRVPSRVRFSPCAKFLSLSSSDALYVYDLRWGQHTYLSRIAPTRSDALADVDMHPKHPATFCGSVDGKLHEFR